MLRNESSSCRACAHRDAVLRRGMSLCLGIRALNPVYVVPSTSSAAPVRTVAGDAVYTPSPTLYSFPPYQTSCRGLIHAARQKNCHSPPPLIRVLMLYATPLTLDPVDHV